MSILFASLTKTAIADTLDAAAYAGQKTAALPIPTLGSKAHAAWEALKGLGGYAVNPQAAQLQAQNENLQESMRRNLPVALIGGGLAGAALMARHVQKKREAETKVAGGPVTPETTDPQGLVNEPGNGGLLANKVRAEMRAAGERWTEANQAPIRQAFRPLTHAMHKEHKVPLALGAGAARGGLLGAAFARQHDRDRK